MTEVCVVDSKGFFIKTADPETYVLEDGERFVNTAPPNMRQYAGYVGFVKPQWKDKWVEAATFQELIMFELTHQKTSDTAGKTIWQTLDESYTEGVNKAYDNE